jgi:hypothetical protein
MILTGRFEMEWRSLWFKQAEEGSKLAIEQHPAIGHTQIVTIAWMQEGHCH